MFLYYLPEDGGMSAKVFTASRFEAFGPNAPVTMCHTERGPDGKPGMVCTPTLLGHAAPGRVGYYPDEQQWERTPHPWWIGYKKSERPGPEDLARAEAYPGHKVTLADGSEWLVPVGRLWDGSDPFPKKLSLDPATGVWREDPLAKFAEITQRAGNLFADLMAAAWSEDESGNPTVTLNVDVDLAVDALALNYHLGQEEASVLGLLTSENIAYIAKAFVDFPTWRKLLATRDDAKKKATLRSFATGSGAPGGSPDTDRVGPTCGSSILGRGE